MNSTVYRVYWSTVGINFKLSPQTKDFVQDEMSAALKFIESLRKEQRQFKNIRFITMCSEHPDSVGYPGVDVTGPEYNWCEDGV